MSREIKFRTWDTEYEEFSEWTNRDPFFSTSHKQLFFWERTRNDDGSYGGDIILEDLGNRFILQQYTGLKGKDGVEIYEGDIVRFSEPIKLAEDCYMSTLYVFDFYNGSFLRPYIYHSINGSKFVKIGETKLNPVGRAKMEDNDHFDLTKAEVVGNIFETPFEIDL